MCSEERTDAYTVSPESLTPRELEILGLYAAGYNNPGIAAKLVLAESTVKWYARQIYGKLGINSRDEAVRKARSLGLLVSEHTLSNLPAPLTPLIGRVAELHFVESLLLKPDCRLLTVTGPGGIGKTRLALQAGTSLASHQYPEFRDGIYFARLEPVSSLIGSIIDALGLELFEGGDSPQEQLVRALRHKNELILLDNFEVLAETEDWSWLVDLLAGAAGIKMLVTSRVRLNLPGEQVFSLEGLVVPPLEDIDAGEKAVERTASYSSVQLFLQAAQRTLPSFVLTEENLKPVKQICLLLEGMPLGIELAAGWIVVLTPLEIQTEVENSLDFLETLQQGVPDRQRSLRAVFQSSWRMLKDVEREAAKRLAVFQGGFNNLTAREVSGLSPKTLRSLLDKSWIQLESSGRFRMYDTSRIYTEEVAREEGSWGAICEEHSRHFLKMAGEHGSRLHSFAFREAMQQLGSEQDNLRAAWFWAVSRHRWRLLEQAASGLFTYYNLYGHSGEGLDLCAMAAEAIFTCAGGEESCLLAYILCWQSVFTHNPAEANRLLEQAQSVLNHSKNKKERSFQEVQAFLWYQTGQFISRTDRQKGVPLFQRSLELYQDLGDEQAAAQSMYSLGWLNWNLLDMRSAQFWLEKALEIQNRIGDYFFAARSLNMLGLVTRNQGQFHQAENLQRESLALSQRVGSQRIYADILPALGYTLAFNGKLEEAEQYVRESIAECARVGYKGAFLANSYSALSWILLGKGDYQGARSAAVNGLSIARQYANPAEIGFNLLHLGLLDLIDRQETSSRELLNESYQVFSNLGHKAAVFPLAYLSYHALAQGDAEHAKVCIGGAIAKTIIGGDAAMAEMVLSPIILYLYRSGKTDIAAGLYAFARILPNTSGWLLELCGEGMARSVGPILKDTRRVDSEVERARMLQEKLEEIIHMVQ